MHSSVHVKGKGVYQLKVTGKLINAEWRVYQARDTALKAEPIDKHTCKTSYNMPQDTVQRSLTNLHCFAELALHVQDRAL
jgi:hypothetical protein